MSFRNNVWLERVLEPVDDEQCFLSIADTLAASIGEDATGHDLGHAWRVFALGTRLAIHEEADPAIVGAAALTHDLHRTLAAPGEYVDPEETLPEIRTILETSDFPRAKIEDVLHCVAVHDQYQYRGIDRPAETLEAKLLRDADNLDAMGAIGIARTFAFSGAAGHPLWRPDDETYAAIDHFEDKLLKLREEMHCETARTIAAKRHTFLEIFRERFEREWHEPFDI